ncbi:MAG: DUF3850 domain-containing protein [Thomasclavelia ramosa]
MNVHNLKIRPNYFKDVIAEVKKFEIRLDIINQLREGVLVLDKRIEVMVVDKGDSKQ